MNEPLSSRPVLYRTSLKWTHDRSGELASPLMPHRPPLHIDLGGPGEQWTPGELLVGAVESCMVATILALARRNGLGLRAYTSNATGMLEADKHGYSITAVALAIHVTVAHEDDRERAGVILQQAEEMCFVCRSLKTNVTVDYTIEVGGASGIDRR